MRTAAAAVKFNDARDITKTKPSLLVRTGPGGARICIYFPLG